MSNPYYTVSDEAEELRDENARLREALERLKVHPLLTRRAGPLEQGALHIVREVLRS